MTLRMRIPGPFVCLQGLPGDGRRNTVQHCPLWPDEEEDEDYNVDDDDDDTEDCDTARSDRDAEVDWLLTPTHQQQQQQQDESEEQPATATTLASLPSPPSFDLSRTAAAFTSPLLAAFPHLRRTVVEEPLVVLSSSSSPPALMDLSTSSSNSSSSTSTTSNSSNSSSSRNCRIQQSSSSSNSSKHKNKRRHCREQEMLQEWHEQCIATVREERQEWRQASLSLNTHCLNAATATTTNNNNNSNNNNNNNEEYDLLLGSNNNNNNNNNNNSSAVTSASAAASLSTPSVAILEHDAPWWLTSDGDLALFDALPSSSSSSTIPVAVGVLTPGTTVHAVALFTVHSATPHQRCTLTVPPLPSLGGDTQLYPPGRRGQMQILQLQWPDHDHDLVEKPCYVVASVDGYPYLLPGNAEHYVVSASNKWWWMVTCIEGAYVRSGIDLATPHIATLPFGALVQVQRHVVNGMGLSRLRIQAVLCNNNNNNTNPDADDDSDDEIVEGWCSEILNPLSGQRGVVLQPLPLPVPAVYRTVRDHVPLHCDRVQAVVGMVARAGTELTVVARQWWCEQRTTAARYQLAGDGGWVDVCDVEYVRMAENFDPDQAGAFHLKAMRRVMQKQQQERQQQQLLQENGSEPDPVTSRTSVTSSVEDGSLVLHDSSNDGNTTNPSHTATTAWSVSLPLYSRSRERNRRRNSDRNDNDSCLICLSEERTATMVHGDTGHVACCLVCARILKARQDPCPVCRMPIDLVIQHFWA